jgi:uncharacterized membrane protein HdeD (DUF308 family)
VRVQATKRTAVNLWAAGFVAAAAIQGLFPEAFARGTKWGYNEGWQREIAIWNLGTLTTIAALRREGADVDRGLIAGFAVLSALFGVNHLWAALRSPRSLGNWMGAASNGVGLGIGIAALSGPQAEARSR